MTTRFSLVRQRQADGATVLVVGGEIDMSNASALDAALMDNADPLVVDLTGVSYLDSAGIAVLFDHAHHIEVVITTLLAPVITVPGLDEIVTVHNRNSTPPA